MARIVVESPLKVGSFVDHGGTTVAQSGAMSPLTSQFDGGGHDRAREQLCLP